MVHVGELTRLITFVEFEGFELILSLFVFVLLDNESFASLVLSGWFSSSFCFLADDYLDPFLNLDF